MATKDRVYSGIGVLTLGALIYLGSGYAGCGSDPRPVGITDSGRYTIKVGDKESVIKTLTVTSSDGSENVMVCESLEDNCINSEAFGNQLENRVQLGEMQTLHRLEEQRKRRQAYGD